MSEHVISVICLTWHPKASSGGHAGPAKELDESLWAQGAHREDPEKFLLGPGEKRN